MYMSAAPVAHSLRPMTGDLKEEQLRWVRAVMAHLGNISANDLARRAGFAPSTLQRPLNDPDWPHALSSATMAKIAMLAGLKPLEYPAKTGAPGFGEPEGVPFEFDTSADAIASNVDRAVRELVRGRNGRDAWVAQSHALELSGILPGDILIVDMNLQPRPKDIVCAQVYQWSHMKADTIFRIYEPPYLLTNSVRYGSQRPLLVNDEDVVIRGVVDGMIRRRANAG